MRRSRTKERGVGGWRMEGRVIRSWMYGIIIADGGFSQGHIYETFNYIKKRLKNVFKTTILFNSILGDIFGMLL